MEKILIILRGCPGSGKSTFAQLLVNVEHICTADDYFIKDGKYEWKPENIGKAHLWCQEKCRRLMAVGMPRIVVANTATTKKELKPYYDLATGYGYKVFSIIVENRHEGKNIHNVPELSIKNMVERFDIKLI